MLATYKAGNPEPVFLWQKSGRTTGGAMNIKPKLLKFNDDTLKQLQEAAKTNIDQELPEGMIVQLEYVTSYYATTIKEIKKKSNNAKPIKLEAVKAFTDMQTMATDLANRMERWSPWMLDNVSVSIKSNIVKGSLELPITIKEQLAVYEKELRKRIEDIKLLNGFFNWQISWTENRKNYLNRSGGKKIDERAHLAERIMNIFDRFKLKHNEEVILEIIIICLGAVGENFQGGSKYSYKNLKDAITQAYESYNINKDITHQAYYGVKYPFTEK
jgi:hypothetical protein